MNLGRNLIFFKVSRRGVSSHTRASHYFFIAYLLINSYLLIYVASYTLGGACWSLSHFLACQLSNSIPLFPSLLLIVYFRYVTSLSCSPYPSLTSQTQGTHVRFLLVCLTRWTCGVLLAFFFIEACQPCIVSALSLMPGLFFG